MHPSARPKPPANLSAASLRSFFRIMDAWQVPARTAMRILGVSPSTFYRWRTNPASARLRSYTVERLSYVFGIYRNLQVLLPNPTAADTWVQRPNQSPILGGMQPLARMAAGHVADLYVVRQYLQSQVDDDGIGYSPLSR